jgi:predicted dehydrogenase
MNQIDDGHDEGVATGPGVAIVGTSFGCLTHLPALRNAGFDVLALVGRDPEKTAALARRFGVPHASTALEDVLAMDDVTAISVATPPDTHAQIVLAAVAAGKHILCEKPFAGDLREAEAMRDAARAAGVVHLLGTEFRWGTGQALMSRTVRDGAIGEPRLATFLLHIPLLADPSAEVPSWWSRSEDHGGWLGAHASHVVDQVRSTLGDISGLSAALPSVVDRAWTAEDSYSIRFRTVGGCDGVIQASAADWGPIMQVARIAGTSGAVWTEGDVVKIANAAGTRTLDVPDDLVTLPAQPPPADLLVTAYDMLHAMGMDIGPYTKLAESFRTLIEGGTLPPDPVPATFDDGVETMAVFDAVRRSAAQGGAWIELQH